MHKRKCKFMKYKSELYGTCRHNTKFHRLTKASTGTDESETGQKSIDNGSTTLVSREENENNESENSNNRLYCRNINDITVSSLNSSNISKSQPTLPTT